MLLGKGGKESALAWKLLQSPRLEALYRAPAPLDGGYIADGVELSDFESVRDFISHKGIDMVIVGSVNLITAGIADYLSDMPVKVIAPSAQCAQLENSKEWAKEFMSINAIPTPRFMTVTTDTIDEGEGFLASLHPPYVLKADGLAEGRGVVLCDDIADAKDTLDSMLAGMFGESSSTVVIEEYIHGRECSLIYALDGENYILLPPVHDFKRLNEGNTGSNTPGMGAVSPVNYVTPEFLRKVEKRILLPTLSGLKEKDMTYKGFLYLGIIEMDGEPLLLEYNVRLGDPETEVIMPRLKSDIIDLLEGIADGTLPLKQITVSPESCVAIVITPREYPGKATRMDTIESVIPSLSAGECLVFPADITRKEGVMYAGSTRVAVVSALAPTVEEAARKALEGADLFDYSNKYFRRDIH